MEKEISTQELAKGVNSYYDLLKQINVIKPIPTKRSIADILIGLLHQKIRYFYLSLVKCYRQTKSFLNTQKVIRYPIAGISLLHKVNNLPQEIEKLNTEYATIYPKIALYKKLIDDGELKRIYTVSSSKLAGMTQQMFQQYFVDLEEYIQKSNIWRHIQNAEHAKENFDDQCKKSESLEGINEKLRFFANTICPFALKIIDLNQLANSINEKLVDLSLVELKGETESLHKKIKSN